jgi:hypothetical protein
MDFQDYQSSRVKKLLLMEDKDGNGTEQHAAGV